ncbi:hypothetical protein [Actinoplanes aureus]|uniref:Uncharacterized protein n=1 Tax=Actinoplanes aureus TaxID=2792083 RepID=A0A931CEV6_9ACTN|nr:hypothetical protein [Actinoplanes aureus]MBG0566227.1 hypothetical protein [Actinoplanes aureus]
MLDDMGDLRDAVAGYRAAAIAAGLTWSATAQPGEPSDLVHRLFDVDHVAEQLIWLHSQGWDARLLPNGGYLLPWPAGGSEALESLAFSIGTPFRWRQQVPLFHFDFLLYTFVLAGDHEGEIWRYEISPDAWDTVRAATSLAGLFTQWTRGIATGVVVHAGHTGWLQVGDGVHRDVDMLLERMPDLDPLAFPVSMPEQPLLRERQRECGVDMDRIERGFDCHEELLDAIAATRASLGD